MLSRARTWFAARVKNGTKSLPLGSDKSAMKRSASLSVGTQRQPEATPQLTPVPNPSSFVSICRRFEHCVLPSVVPRTKTVAVVYNTNDLRVHDHYPLALACQRAKELSLPVVCLLCLDVRLFAQPSRVIGCFRTGPLRAAFVLSCVAALRAELAKCNVPLLVRYGFPEDVVPPLLHQLQAVDCFLTTQYAPHEKAVHDKLLDMPQLAERSTKMHSVWQSTLLHIDDLITQPEEMREGFRWFHEEAVLTSIRPTRPYACQGTLSALPSLLKYFDEYESATSCGSSYDEDVRNERESGVTVVGLGRVPSLEDLGYRNVPEMSPNTVIATSSAHGESGGEQCASDRLEDWLSQNGMKNMLGVGKPKRSPVKMYSETLSKLSPYLSTGSLSPRKLYERVREYTYDHAVDGFTSLQYHELLLRLFKRDYWHFVGLQYGNALFYSYGPRPEFTDDVADYRLDNKIVQKWCHGLTGFPFADASMKELTTTGWVAEPGRQALMWLLSCGLSQDWRAGAEWFERCSLDYDPFVCYGNAAYYSNLLRDDFGDRVFDLHYLAHKHDQTGVYVKKWLPLLSRIPAVYIHRPHVMSQKMQDMHQVMLGKHYPYPIKLWDGAQRTLGASDLTTYFASSPETSTFGVHEALHVSSDSVLHVSQRHLAATDVSYKRVEAAIAELRLEGTAVFPEAEAMAPAAASTSAKQPQKQRLQSFES